MGHFLKLFSMGGHDDDPRLRPGISSCFQYLPSVQFRHHQVGDDEIEGLPSNGFNGLPAIFDRKNLVTLLREGLV